MRAEKNISNLLGISQENLAMLLNVSRGQLSMYELGLRPLPLAALEKLAGMVSLFYEEDPPAASKASRQQDWAKHAGVIQKQLDNNLYEQYGLARTLERAEQKYKARITTLNFLKKLSSKQDRNDSGEPTLPELLEHQTAVKLQKESWSQLRQYQIRLELLKHEEKLLREELEKDRKE